MQHEKALLLCESMVRAGWVFSLYCAACVLMEDAAHK